MTGEGTPIHHQEQPQEQRASPGQQFRTELGRSFRSFLKGLHYVVTLPGRGPELEQKDVTPPEPAPQEPPNPS